MSLAVVAGAAAAAADAEEEAADEDAAAAEAAGAAGTPPGGTVGFRRCGSNLQPFFFVCGAVSTLVPSESFLWVPCWQRSQFQ